MNITNDPGRGKLSNERVLKKIERNLYEGSDTLELRRFGQLEKLPSEIGRLVHLRHLILDCNGLTGVPEEIGLLTNLQTLDLGGTRFPHYRRRSPDSPI